MKQALVDIYQKELNYLNRQGEAFAEAFPKVGARLRITNEQARDPHVERILQGVAFLNARIRKKLDDEFPELCQALLDVLYPHYLRPLPSYSIISFQPEFDITSVATIPRGRAIELEDSSQFPCRFTTIYDTDVLPLRLVSAKLKTCPTDAPNPGNMSDIESVLCLSLETTSPDLALETLNIDKVRLYLKGNHHYSFSLYELLMNHCVNMAVAEHAFDPAAVFQASTAIKPVGFEPEQGMIDYPDQSFPGYRLLTEFFAYTEKFLFLDITLGQAAQAKLIGNRLEIYFYFDKSLPEIESTISYKNFVLNATPIINLYEHVAEPVRIDHETYEYAVVADARNPDAVEIYDIEDVQLSTQDNTTQRVRPFFGVDGLFHSHHSDLSWHARREEREIGNVRSQTLISLVNLPGLIQDQEQQDLVLLTRLSVFNGNLPKRLTELQQQPTLQLMTGSSSVDRIQVETPFTAATRAPLDDNLYWQLLSHLNLNYVSLTAGGEGTSALQKILQLYNHSDKSEFVKMIEALRIDAVETTTARISDEKGHPFYCRGSHIKLNIERANFAGSSPYLFAAVLERFFSLYTQVNAFTRLTVTLGDQGVLKDWPARAGDHPLL